MSSFPHPLIFIDHRSPIDLFICLCQEEEVVDPQFEPVIKLTEQVETKTHEEDEDVLFKMCVYAIEIGRASCRERVCLAV